MQIERKIYAPNFLTRKNLEENLYRLILKYRKGKDKLYILDIGCGKKLYKLFWRDSDYYIGLDITSDSNADILGDCAYLPFKDSCFDFVVAYAVLEHVSDPILMLKECSRVLKQNGKLIISVPFLFPYHPTPQDHWRWTQSGIKILVESIEDLKVEEIIPCGGTISSLMFLHVWYLNLFFNKIKRRVKKQLNFLVEAGRISSLSILNLIAYLLDNKFSKLRDPKKSNTLFLNFIVVADKR